MSPREANDNEPVSPLGHDEPADGAASPPQTDPPKVLGRDPVAALPQRFYTTVATLPTPTGTAILLDGRPVKTPGKQPLHVPTLALASLIAAEWLAQGKFIDPTTMPITRLANTTIDAVAPNAAAVGDDIVQFAGSDALCYRAVESVLAAKQAAAWDPVLTWAEQALGATFSVVSGIVHVPQPAPTLNAIAHDLKGKSPFQIASIHVMTTLMGSAVLALAVAHRHLTPSEAWTAAHIDEDWQISTWGTDEEAQARREARWRDFQAAVALLHAVQA